MINRILLGLFCSVILLGCNSEGGGSGSENSLTLDANTAESMAVYAEMGLAVRELAVDATLEASGASPRSNSGDLSRASVRNFDDCYTESYFGNSTGGMATVTYSNCDAFGIIFSSEIVVSWSHVGEVQTFEVEGDYSLTITDQNSGTTIVISFDPMDAKVVDNGSTSSTEMDFKFNYDDGTNTGYLAMKTIEPLVTSSEDYETITSGSIQMNDDQGNIFLITFSGGAATVTPG